MAESNIPEAVREELKKRGHTIELTEYGSNGKLMGIRYNKETGVISGGCSPKGNIGYTIGW